MVPAGASRSAVAEVEAADRAHHGDPPARVPGASWAAEAAAACSPAAEPSAAALLAADWGWAAHSAAFPHSDPEGFPRQVQDLDGGNFPDLPANHFRVACQDLRVHRWPEASPAGAYPELADHQRAACPFQWCSAASPLQLEGSTPDQAAVPQAMAAFPRCYREVSLGLEVLRVDSAVRPGQLVQRVELPEPE